jgi:CubicO group peptidase (beta-lactamase class C family)
MQFLGPGRSLLGAEAIRRAREDQTPGLQEARSLAFLIAARGETSAGPDLPGAAFGHNGFPGTSVWIDPVRQRVYVLLTNRVHPRAIEGYDMMPLRRRFHSLASGI